MTDVALVTGGAGGIGRAIVDGLCATGWAVLGGDVSVPLDAGADGPAAPGTVAWRTVDVRSTRSVEEGVGAALALGTLRGVVNCAGILRPARLAEVTDEDIDDLLSVNLGGMVRVCRAVMPHLGPGASIVNIGSLAAIRGGVREVPVYGASKAGVLGLTRNLACEFGPRGVRVNVVAPGIVRAPMSTMIRDRVDEERLVKTVPLRRLAEPSDIADAVEFLLSPKASYITGAMLLVDGGVAAR